jgi:hypothetical protein
MLALRILPSAIAICGIIALVLENSYVSVPIYKGVQHPVGTDIASVHTADDGTSAPIVPIQRWQNDSLVDTGQQVHVYIKNWYRDSDIRDVRNRTIKVLLIFVVLYAVAVLLRKLLDDRKRT